MPEEMKRKLRARASQLNLPEPSRRAYVYGTMRKTGWKPKAQDVNTPEPKEKTATKKAFKKSNPITSGRHSLGRKEWSARQVALKKRLNSE